MSIGKSYIGQTINKFSYRLSSHLRSSKKEKPKTYIHKSIKKYGWKNFSKEIICSCITDIEDLNELEIFFIKEFNTFGEGYNLTIGGENLKGKNNPMFGKKHSNKTKKLMSKNHANYKGKNHPLYGKNHNKESKIKNMFSQPNIKKIICIETNMIFNSIRECSRTLKIDLGSLSKHLKGNLQHVNQLHFKHV